MKLQIAQSKMCQNNNEWRLRKNKKQFGDKKHHYE